LIPRARTKSRRSNPAARHDIFFTFSIQLHDKSRDLES
jgi:hypothetical protein